MDVGTNISTLMLLYSTNMSEIIILLAFHYLPSLETLKTSQVLEDQQPLLDLGQNSVFLKCYVS